MLNYICPHCVIVMANLGFDPAPTGTFSIFLSTKIPSIILPKTTCLPSKNSQFLVQVMKNWHPFVSLPEFAELNKPTSLCFRIKFSSGNREPL